MGFDQFNSNSERLQAEAGDTLHSPRRHEREQKSRSYGNGGDWQKWEGGTHSGANPFAAATARDQGLPNHDRDQTSISELGCSSNEQTSSGYGYSSADIWWQNEGRLSEQVEQGSYEYYQFTMQTRLHDAAGTSSSVENIPAIDNDVNHPKIVLIDNLVYSNKPRLTAGDVREAIKSFNHSELKACKQYALSRYKALQSDNTRAKDRFNTIVTYINERLEN